MSLKVSWDSKKNQHEGAVPEDAPCRRFCTSRTEKRPSDQAQTKHQLACARTGTCSTVEESLMLCTGAAAFPIIQIMNNTLSSLVPPPAAPLRTATRRGRARVLLLLFGSIVVTGSVLHVLLLQLNPAAKQQQQQQHYSCPS